MLQRGWREQGELIRFRLGPREFFLFTGPEAHDFYFHAPEDQLSAKEVYQFTVPIFGRGVAYDTTPELMLEQLGFLYPALNEAAMRRFARIMFKETWQFAEDLGESGEIDLPHAMNELTVKIASRCLIGEEVRAQLDAGFAEAYHELQNGINTLGFFFPYLPIPAHRSRDRARRKVAKLFGQIMAERRRTEAQPEDFMQTLMDARYKDGHAPSDDEITGILLTVLFAGQHTSAVLATWTLLELMREPSYLERIQNEMQDTYREAGTVSYESLRHQVTLEHAIREWRADAPPADHVDPQGPQTLALQGPCRAGRCPGHGVAGGRSAIAPPVCRPEPLQSGPVRPTRIRRQTAPLCLDQFRWRQTPVHR